MHRTPSPRAQSGPKKAARVVASAFCDRTSEIARLLALRERKEFVWPKTCPAAFCPATLHSGRARSLPLFLTINWLKPCPFLEPSGR
ncbi:hypothetical protein NITHO_5160016 [Nitrolancea hollandica Lb]|uniref:Uncharacterized protein n=1 Tax=Nitrolancea hollandica Lb TaxID=1129897 RepID=I4ELL0_9BACT|nr:hypothetical protein NITHO_5160016 [Nitrolancea hollandica Lb]